MKIIKHKTKQTAGKDMEKLELHILPAGIEDSLVTTENKLWEFLRKHGINIFQCNLKRIEIKQ